MQRAQDDYFRLNFWEPAMTKATTYGVTSALGKAMYYDMEIQGPALVDGFSNRALKKWSDSNGITPSATACKPADPNGPGEKEYLYLVNAERRSKMAGSSNDLYKSTVYRPDGFDRLLDQDNMSMSKDFSLREQQIKGLP